MRVNVVCRNFPVDRILPRFARYLRDGLGWHLSAKPDGEADVLYLMGYFEKQVSPGWEQRTTASLFTHREEDPRAADKAKLFDHVAARVSLRVAMCRKYGTVLEAYGPVIQPPLPVELERFTIAPKRKKQLPAVGVAGWPYSSGRKGSSVLASALKLAQCPRVDWRFTGGSWRAAGHAAARVRADRPWEQMPAWYQDLDVLVCPSLVEGGPMPPLEALACGVPVVVPVGVGVLDELPAHPGIVRYRRGDAADLVRALRVALTQPAVDRDALRGIVAGNSVEAWCRGHAEGFAARFAGRAAA